MHESLNSKCSKDELMFLATTLVSNDDFCSGNSPRGVRDFLDLLQAFDPGR